METDQEPSASDGICPAPGQVPVKTWLSSSKRGAAVAKTLASTISRFQGDGVRYRAKLIGVDPVPEAQGDKMCLDSMMKLKGLEMAARSQGKHKQRVWLMVSTTSLKMVDERTGAVAHYHESGRISSLRKDESDPRALAYIYHHQDTYMLFYIKMVNLADPVLEDIKEVCQSLDQETQEEPVEKPTQVSTLLLLDENPACQPKVSGDVDLFNPLPSSPSEQPKQASSTDELMDIFSIRLEEPPAPSQSSDTSQPGPPQQSLSLSEILSNYPSPPVGGSPYSSPTSMPWGQQWPLANQPPSSNGQWMAPAPWPPQPVGMTHWAPAGGMMPPGGAPLPAYSVTPQPGVMWGQNTAGYPPAHPAAATNVGYPTSAAMYTPSGGNGLQQPAFPTTAHKPSLI